VNLADIRLRLQDFYGSTISDDDAFYNRVINDAYLELAGLADWWWLETSELLRFTAANTAVSVAANTGTAELVLDPGAVATAYKFGWLSTGGQTYRVDDVTASGTGVTLTADANFIEGSATYTCNIWNDTLTLNSQLDRPVGMWPRNDPNRKGLQHVQPEQIYAFGPDVSSYATEHADRFCILKEPAYASTDTRLRIFPPPSEVAEYRFDYLQVPTAMANDTASHLIPQKHEVGLVAFAMLKLAKIDRDNPDLVMNFDVDYQRALARMIRDHERRGGIMTRVKRRGIESVGRMDFRLTNVTAGGI
jgi:hypothetical protein